MNTAGIINKVAARNMRILGVKPFNPAERLSTLNPADRLIAMRAAKQWYAEQGIDPLQSEAMAQADVSKMFGG